MTENADATSAARDAIAAIPRHQLPKWLAEALDLIARNAAVFPPLEETGDIPEHFYPH